MVKLILASSTNDVIGYKNKIPFHLPDDLKLFKEKTLNSTIVMGRKTFESFPNGRPLSERENVVVSRTGFIPNDPTVKVINDLDDYLTNLNPNKDVWIIGGAQIYKQAMKYVDEIHHTKVFILCKGDVEFCIEDYLNDFNLVECTRFIDYKSKKIPFVVNRFERKR